MLWDLRFLLNEPSHRSSKYVGRSKGCSHFRFFLRIWCVSKRANKFISQVLRVNQHRNRLEKNSWWENKANSEHEKWNVLRTIDCISRTIDDRAFFSSLQNMNEAFVWSTLARPFGEFDMALRVAFKWRFKWFSFAADSEKSYESLFFQWWWWLAEENLDIASRYLCRESGTRNNDDGWLKKTLTLLCFAILMAKLLIKILLTNDNDDWLPDIVSQYESSARFHLSWWLWLAEKDPDVVLDLCAHHLMQSRIRSWLLWWISSDLYDVMGITAAYIIHPYGPFRPTTTYWTSRTSLK